MPEKEEEDHEEEEGEEKGNALDFDINSIPSKFTGLSERSCIDLVQKLGELEHVRAVPTTTGQEWLTLEQLDVEIAQALTDSGGRISITELPNAVGVAMQHCEARAEHLCKEDSSVTMLQGDLLATDYLKSVAQEVDVCLEASGCHGISDIAVHYNLPAEFVRDELLTHVATPHYIKQNTIYTNTHATRVEAYARGALRGCILPLPLGQLATRHRLDADLLATVVQKMLKDGAIQGKLQGSTFTPKVCSDAKENKVDDFYKANQYLPLSLARSSGINVKDWVRTKEVDGVFLSNAFISQQLVEPVLVSVSEALSSESFVDVTPILPPSLAAAESAELLQHLAGKKSIPSNGVVMDHVVVSQELLKSIASHFEGEAKSAAERLMTSSSTSASKPGGRGAADDEEDGGGSKKKGKRAAKGKKAAQVEEEKDEGGPGGGDSGIDSQAVVDVLMEQFPELPGDVHAEICSHVQPLLAAMVAEAQAALRATKESQLKERFEKVEKLVQEKYEKLVLGVKALEANDMVGSPLETYLLKETAAEPLHRLLSLRLEDVSGTQLDVTASNRRQCLDQISAKEGAAKVECLSRLMTFLSRGKDSKGKDGKAGKASKEEKAGKDSKSGKEKKGRAKKGDKSDDEDAKEDESKEAQDVTELYHAAANECHIFCRKVDKKREKAVLQEQLAASRERLQASTDAVEVCTLGLQLALLQEGIVGLLFPVECWALRFVAQSLGDKDARKDAYVLCLAIEKAEEFREACPTTPAPPCSRQEYEEEWQSSLTRSLVGKAEKALAELADEAGEDSEDSAAVREAAVRAWKERALASK